MISRFILFNLKMKFMVVFLDSNLFQNLILVLTVLVTIYIYYGRKRQNLSNAVTILSLQIRDIENNIESLIAEGLIGDQLQERALHYSTIIYEENYWLKYNHLIAGRVDAQTYGVLDNFYKIAFKIREQQLMIKNKLLQSMDYKGMYYYNGIFSRVNGILDKQGGVESDKLLDICKAEVSLLQSLYNHDITNPPAFIQVELVRGLSKKLEQYHKITDGVAFSKLLKLK